MTTNNPYDQDEPTRSHADIRSSGGRDVNPSDADVVDDLQDLVSINIDSQRGWQEAADHTKDASLKSFFREMGEARRRNAEELKEAVRQCGEEPTDSGSAAATMHRWWIDAKQAIMGGDAESVLKEAERGEDSIKDEYEKALDETAGHPVHILIQQQFANIREGHDRVKAMRERYKNP